MLPPIQRYLTGMWSALLGRLTRCATEFPVRLSALIGRLRRALLWSRQHLAAGWLTFVGCSGRARERLRAARAQDLRNLGISPLGALTSLMNAVGTGLVVLVMFVILADVAGRTFFRVPLRGTAEIVAMSIAAIVFLQFPSTLRAGRVIQTDGLLDWVGARSVRAEQYLLAAYHVLGGVMFIIVCAFVCPMLLSVWEGREFYGNIGVFTFPKWPVFAVIAFGTAVMAIQYFVLAIQYVGAGRQGRRLTEVDPATRVMS